MSVLLGIQNPIGESARDQCVDKLDDDARKTCSMEWSGFFACLRCLRRSLSPASCLGTWIGLGRNVS